MQNHLWVARSAAGEIHEHRVGSKRVYVFEFIGRLTDAGVEVMPALALNSGSTNALFARKNRANKLVFWKDPVAIFVLGAQTTSSAVHQEEVLNGRAFCNDVVNDLGDVTYRGANDCLDGCAVQAINKVMLLQHERRRNHDSAKFGQGSSHKPELIVTAKDYHNVIALGDAMFCEVISGFVGPLLHVRESEDVLFSFGTAPYHSTTVGIVYRDVINDVVTEIEVCRDVYFEVAKHAFTIVCLFDIPFMQVSHIVFLTEGIKLSSVVRRLRRRHAAAWGLPKSRLRSA